MNDKNLKNNEQKQSKDDIKNDNKSENKDITKK